MTEKKNEVVAWKFGNPDTGYGYTMEKPDERIPEKYYEELTLADLLEELTEKGKPIHRVWLNLNTGEFSNSWFKDSWEDSLLKEEDITNGPAGWKLIEYRCHNDEKFQFSTLMKLR